MCLMVPGHMTTGPKGETLGVAETELIQTESRPLGPSPWFPVQGEVTPRTLPSETVGCHDW